MKMENETIIDVRMSAAEIRIGALEALVNQLTLGKMKGAMSKRLTKEEKSQKKDELLQKVPYDKKGLEALNGPDLKMLASALEINSFGIKRNDLIKQIFVKQKK
jgi:hypothetical protein